MSERPSSPIGSPGLLASVPRIIRDDIRGMPRSDDAERSVLSCFLQWPNELLGHAATHLSPDHFYHVGNRLIYEEMQAFQAQPQEKPMDTVTFSEWLMQRQLLDKIGGPATLAELYNFSPTPAHYKYHSGILSDKLLLRQIIRACMECIQTTYDNEETPGDALSIVSEQIMELENTTGDKFRRMPELVTNAITRYEEAMKLNGRLPGIPTGFAGLDNQTGGMCRGDLWVLAGGTSDAKSAFSENLAHAAVIRSHAVALYTFEMSDERMTDRFFCIDGQVPNGCLKHGRLDEEQARNVVSASERLMKYPLYIRDVSGMKLSALLADMRALKRRFNIEVFIIDYGQLVEADKKGHTRESEVAEMSRRLKKASKNLDACLIVLSQLNERGQLRESKAIGHDGDIVLTLSVPDLEDGEEGERDEARRLLQISKNRDGARGVTLKFHFNGPTFTFTEDPNK